MDAREIRNLLVAIETQARLASSSKTRPHLSAHCRQLESHLHQLLEVLRYALPEASSEEEKLPQKVVEQFIRFWLGHLKPEARGRLSRPDIIGSAMLQEIADLFVRSLALVVGKDHVTDFYPKNTEMEARRICTSLLTSCNEVLTKPPAPASAVTPIKAKRGSATLRVIK